MRADCLVVIVGNLVVYRIGRKDLQDLFLDGHLNFLETG